MGKEVDWGNWERGKEGGRRTKMTDRKKLCVCVWNYCHTVICGLLVLPEWCLMACVELEAACLR